MIEIKGIKDNDSKIDTKIEKFNPKDKRFSLGLPDLEAKE